MDTYKEISEKDWFELLQHLDAAKPDYETMAKNDLIKIIEGLGHDSKNIQENGIPNAIVLPMKFTADVVVQFKKMMQFTNCIVYRSEWVESLTLSWCEVHNIRRVKNFESPQYEDLFVK